MPFRLNLIRHAKSSWGDPFADDHARVLNTRGIQSAKAMGAWMDNAGYTLGQVLCSDAARTRETLGLVSTAFDGEVDVQFSRDLYLASATAMLAQLRAATSPVVTMIGHNPGIGSLAGGLVSTQPQDEDFGRYPTCATSIFEFDISAWDEVTPGSGALINFTVPRRLTD